ncbi:MAG: protein translocase subunit SecD, partial [Chloroflexi bacterium]|nr:protein translocase subunit SecD [Chloroflexota bacterium]
MPRRNTLVFMAVLLLFILALLVVFPIERGLGGRGIRLGLDLQGGVHMVYRADLSAIAPAEQANALAAAQAVLENRVNPLGVTEPIVQRQGTDRIIVELPGRSITDKEKESLARVDILEFGEKTTDNATAKWENELGKWKPATDIINGEEKVLTSRYFKTNTQVSRDNLGGIELNFQWDKEGGQLSEKITGRLIGKQLAIFDGADALRGEDGRPIAPTVQAVITEGGRITGLTLNDATRLSKQLNYGRLPVPLEAIYDQTVSPILGADFVRMSVRAGIAAVAIIMLFMILYYHLSGVIASLGLI